MSAQPVDVLAVMGRWRRAAFRDAGMRSVYAGCVAAYRAKGAAYMAEGNSAAVMFRRGFTGTPVGSLLAWDAASRKTFAYAQFRAGQDCAADEARAAVAELIEAAKAYRDDDEQWNDDEEPATSDAARSRNLRVRMWKRLDAALARIGGAA
jgi:hypothetical protein